MAETIFVQPARTDRKVILTEAHEDHPNGEIFIAAFPDRPITEVARTPGVNEALHRGDLVEVPAPAKAAKAAKASKTEKPAGEPAPSGEQA